MGTDARTGKLIARRLAHLPSGTVSFESVGEERLLGRVDCEPQIMRMDPPKVKVGDKCKGGGVCVHEHCRASRYVRGREGEIVMGRIFCLQICHMVH